VWDCHAHNSVHGIDLPFRGGVLSQATGSAAPFGKAVLDFEDADHQFQSLKAAATPARPATPQTKRPAATRLKILHT
jgi:hypothetical protein